MKTLLFLVLVNFSFYVSAQTKYTSVSEDFIVFHTNISAGERMFKNDSLLQAYAQFDNAFENYKGAINPRHYFKAAVCAIKIKEEFKALEFLEKAISNGYELDSTKKQELGFYNLNTKKEYFENITKWETTRNTFRNTTFERELISMGDESKKYNDKKYKLTIESYLTSMKSKSVSKTSPDFLSKKRIVNEKMKADSISATKLLKSISQNGFPTMKLVGKKANEIARKILLNYDSDKKNEQLDGLLSRAMIDGNLSPEFYATLIDRRNLMNGLTPTFYEPVIGYEKTIGKDLLNANKNRRTIGLYPISSSSLVIQKVKDPKAVKPYLGLYDY